jgi:hypothetical protein
MVSAPFAGWRGFMVWLLCGDRVACADGVFVSGRVAWCDGVVCFVCLVCRAPQFERVEMNQYRLLVQALETELEEFDLCCPENFRWGARTAAPAGCARSLARVACVCNMASAARWWLAWVFVS